MVSQSAVSTYSGAPRQLRVRKSPSAVTVHSCLTHQEAIQSLPFSADTRRVQLLQSRHASLAVGRPISHYPPSLVIVSTWTPDGTVRIPKLLSFLIIGVA